VIDPVEIVRLLGLQKHPKEGGWFFETWRGSDVLPASALPERYQTARNAGTAIYYLLDRDSISALHRLASDEVFHFYLGDPVEMLQLLPDGGSRIVTLGQDILAGQSLQTVVPAMAWQGARLKAGGRFALLGCTVAPGFDYADYEHALDEAALLAAWPDRSEMIRGLMRPLAT
jgi:predicted cupin superfamily sugar epimerase